MRLTRFRIKGVKSIKDSGNCYLSGDNITILAGQNESGKTAVLQALDYFSNGMSDVFKKYALRDDGIKPYVECEFKLTKNDIDVLSQTDDRFPIIAKKLKTIIAYREKAEEEIDFLEDATIQVDEIIKSKILLTCFESLDKSEEDSEATEEDEIQETAEDFSFLFWGAIKELMPEFIYYDSFKDLLPDSIQVGNIPENKAVQDLENISGIKFTDIAGMNKRSRKNTLDTAFRDLTFNFKEYWSQHLSDEDDSPYEFLCVIDNQEIEFYVRRSVGNALYLAQKSQGFKWFHSFYLRLRSHQIENQESDFILLIDEPGQGLHETAQRDVKRVIEDLVLRGAQIIYSTHHPLLIDVDDKISRLRLVYKNEDDVSKIGTMSQCASGKKQTLDMLSPIITAMGLVHVDFCNDKLNVVLEGITDKFYLEAFRKCLEREDGYNFIPASGADNIKHIVSILLGWGHDFKILHDKKQTVYNKLVKAFFPHINVTEEIDRKILHLNNCVGIEDMFSKNDFKKHVLGNIDTSNVDLEKDNSAIAKEVGKELLARLFLNQMQSPDDKITKNAFEKHTIQEFENIFNWLGERNNEN